MLKKLTLSKILLVLIPILGAGQVFLNFVGPWAAFSLLSPKWLVVFVMLLTLQLAPLWLLANPNGQSSIKQWGSAIFKYAGKGGWQGIAMAALFGIVYFAILVYTPANLLFFLYISGVFTHISLLTLLVILGRALSGKNDGAHFGWAEVAAALVLYGLANIGTLSSLYYAGQTHLFFSLTILAYLLLVLPTDQISWPASLKTWSTGGQLVNSLLLLTLAFAVLVFFKTAITGGFTLPTIMDEGSYGIKGLLFTSGKYKPFQDYGPWTNKMPLAFLFPGYIQQAFGHGLGVLRSASFIMMLAMMALLYATGKRIWNPYGGVLVLIFFCFNPAIDNFYSLANSQVYTALWLTISAYFVFGRSQNTVDLVLSNIAAVIAVLTRENVAPYLLLLNIFIVWKFGIRKSIPILVAGALVFVIGHWFFWPGILKIWAKWMPRPLTPFLDPFRYAGGGKVSWKLTGIKPDLIATINSFMQGIASNFYALVGLVALPFVVNWKNFTKNNGFKDLLFLCATLLVLNISHGFITLDDGSCIYCFPGYLSFYLPLGIMFTTLVLKYVHELPRQKGIFFVLLASALFTTSNWFIYRQSLESLLYNKVPSLVSENGVQPLLFILQQNFGASPDFLKIYYPVILGLASFVFILYSIWVITHSLLGNRKAHELVFNIMLVFSLLAPPLANVWMDWRPREDTCKADVLAAHQTVDAELKKVIPINSKVYWLGESTTPFLTMDVVLYPQQINDGFSFKVGSKDDVAEKYGFWNANISAKWADDADYLMIEERYLANPIIESFDLKKFKRIAKTSPLNPCDPTSRYFIYTR